MGKKARELRKKVKTEFERLSPRYRETEFGELKLRLSKTEARRVLLRKAALFSAREREILQVIQDQAVADIRAQLDAEVFGLLAQAAEDLCLKDMPKPWPAEVLVGEET